MKKKKSDYLFATIIFSFLFILVFSIVLVPYGKSKIAENKASIENFIKEKEKNPGEIVICGFESKEEIILDYNLELIETIKNLSSIEKTSYVTEYNDANMIFGDFSSDKKYYSYLILYNYRFIKIFNYNDGSSGRSYYLVSLEDGKRIVEKAKETINREKSFLVNERKEMKKLISWDLFINSNSLNYNYSLDKNLDEYKYIDKDKRALNILKNIEHEIIDESVYNPILRYGYSNDDRIDFILDKSYEKITFRIEKKNRYNILFYSNVSYKISKEDGMKLYNSLKG